MKTITAMAAKSLGKFLVKDFRQIFGSPHLEFAERLDAMARSTIECLGRSDALYHNLEHTMLRDHGWSRHSAGKNADRAYRTCRLRSPHHRLSAARYRIHTRRSERRQKTDFVVDESGKTVTLPRGASDAALAPYHVDRSKIFVFERLGKSPTILGMMHLYERSPGMARAAPRSRDLVAFRRIDVIVRGAGAIDWVLYY